MIKTYKQLRELLSQGKRIQFSVKGGEGRVCWSPLRDEHTLNLAFYDYRIHPADNRTEWFDCKPVHEGVYEMEDVEDFPYSKGGNYQYWNGTYWGVYTHNPDMAIQSKDLPSKFQNRKWRGLIDPS